jgi:hypothetical protein
MKIKATLLFIALSCAATQAQNEKAPGNNQPVQSGNTLIRTQAKKAYSYEKRSASGTVIQCYTQGQFDQLPPNRKNYYAQHKDQYQIIKSSK